ncbi:hypothetical protein SLEP1_g53482 [Rubroshorea leprosula]|uniref:Uncharacterized protein n=1 Tax=Rubroshorea leprosula TaxID=152421 RepID=A0AAV5MAD4_9ROSI|nr:hypothetical protein SLEP1_g53482 [Rubroshorea leprosula]
MNLVCATRLSKAISNILRFVISDELSLLSRSDKCGHNDELLEEQSTRPEEEKEGVISIEPIAIIVPLALQDLPERKTPESSASASAGDDGGDHHASPSSSSSSEETPSREEKTGNVVGNEPDLPVVGEWENRVITGILSNLCKAPKELPSGFRFRAALHHEVVDNAPSISGYKKLEEMRREVVLPLWEGKEPALKKRENKVARWKRQFIFVRDTQTERINNDLAARLSEWCVPNAHVNYPQLLPRDTDLKNQLLEYARRENLIDLEALVTSEQLAVFGFVDVANQFTEGEMSSILERQRQRAQGSRNRGAGFGSQRQTHFDERPHAAPGRSSLHRSSSSAPRPCAEQRVETAPSNSRRRAQEDLDIEDNIPLIRRRTTGPRIAYPDGFNYVRTDCQAAMVQGMQSFVPPADRQRAKGHVQQHGGHAALLKLMDAFSYTVALFKCKQGARSLEMENRTASVESRADELARKVNELREELEKAQAKKESGIQAAKEEVDRAEDQAKKAESDREKTLHKLNALKERVSKADLHVARVEAFLEKSKRLHQRDVCFARALGAEWLVGADMGEEIDEEGKSLALPTDTRVRLKWELNEEGLPVWPPSVVEEGEDTEGLPSFDAWVVDPQDVLVEPSSTPPSSQPASAAAPAFSPPHRSSAVPTDASIPVDLTD